MFPPSQRPANRRGFTLVEMLVVITIIGIIAAVAVPGIMGAVTTARNAAIKVEINNLSQAIQEYKNQNSDYFPDFTQLMPGGYPSTDTVWNASIAGRHMKKIARRARANGNAAGSQNLAALEWDDVNASYTSTGRTCYQDLDAAEALVFFLWGLSKDVERPFTGPGGPMDRDPTNFPAINPSGNFDSIFEFDQTRLADRDGDGFWEYYPKYNVGLPYVYFDSRSYSLSSGSPAVGTAVYPSIKVTGQRTPANEVRSYLRDDPSGVTFAGSSSYQILCAGLDGEFGNYPVSAIAATAKSWPSGLNYDRTDHDNLASFNERSTLGDDLP